MAILEINFAPSKQELKWFGFLLAVFFSLVGGLIFWFGGNTTLTLVFCSIGVFLGVLYYAVPPLRHPMYIGWMRLLYPVGWLISHLLIGLVFYLLFTPIGLIMRVIGHDPLQRRRGRNVQTYWIEHPDDTQISRYFRQY